MRMLLLIFLFSACSALSVEILRTEEERTKLSEAVFTGTITATNFLSELQSGALWSAQIRVESIQKPDPDLKTNALISNALIYYEQTFSVIDERGARMHGRICPRYPDIVVGQKMKFWCTRWTVEGHTNILFVHSPSWTKRQ